MMKRKVRCSITVQFSQVEYDEMCELARILERSKADTLRLAARRWLAQIQSEGSQKHNPIAQVIKAK